MVLTLRLFTLIALYSFCSASSIERRSAEKEENDDNRGKDYGLRVFGNVKNSLMKTKADHKATIDGDVVDSNVHNLGSNAKNGYIDNEGGLHVRGNVESSNMTNYANHKAKVEGASIESDGQQNRMNDFSQPRENPQAGSSSSRDGDQLEAGCSEDGTTDGPENDAYDEHQDPA